MNKQALDSLAKEQIEKSNKLQEYRNGIKQDLESKMQLQHLEEIKNHKIEEEQRKYFSGKSFIYYPY